ncbi:MAG: FAD-dependent monooxygenase [Alphaproteobacteria bacterium]|nr:FAD-dependent monooxygenase [Alphaproteobacteria bacterium]
MSDIRNARHAVVIAGGGPTGMMLAGELALAGIDAAIVEQRTGPELGGARAGGLHARSLEILDQRGIVDRFLAEGTVAQVAGFAWTRLDISDFPTRHPYGLALWQNHIERLLGDWVAASKVPIYRGQAVTGFAEDESGIAVALSGGASLQADYLVGCDGGRSLVRKTAGIAFPGWEPTLSHILAEAETTEEPAWGLRHDMLGFHGLARAESGAVRILVTERDLRRGGAPTLQELRDALAAVYGTDYGVRNVTAISRFTDTARQAERYRKGRVLLAGDAAHIHHSVGGQGLNLGLQDAVNLGWKLARVIEGTSPESLLDTYHAERHPIAARVLRHTMAQIELLRRADDHRKAAREIVGELLEMEEPRKRFAAMLSGLDVQYDLGKGHPLVGRRMPDLDLITEKGPVRISSLLHRGRPAFIAFGEPFDIAPWTDRVPVIRARYDGAWELPVLGLVPAPDAVLVRPDGHVAWAGDAPGPAEALRRWFGDPR